MSTLRANTIQTLAGKPILNSTGSVLQVVNINTVGQSGSLATTSASYISTGFNLSITPISSTSRLLVTCVLESIFFGGGVDDGAAFQIRRDGVAINTGNSGDTLSYNNTTPGYSHYSHTIIHYVNANSTNTTNFELYFLNGWGGTAYLDRNWGTNSITIMEISA